MRIIFALDHLQWRQFRIAGDDAGHPRDGSPRITSARLVSRRPQGIAVRILTRLNSWNHLVFSESRCGNTCTFLITENIIGWLRLLSEAALVGAVLWGTLSGAMLPFLLRRCGLDQAASSAPFVATLVDVTGLVIYFNVALFILRGTLL